MYVDLYIYTSSRPLIRLPKNNSSDTHINPFSIRYVTSSETQVIMHLNTLKRVQVFRNIRILTRAVSIKTGFRRSVYKNTVVTA